MDATTRCHYVSFGYSLSLTGKKITKLLRHTNKVANTIIDNEDTPIQTYANKGFMNRMRVVNFALLLHKRAEIKLAGI